MTTGIEPSSAAPSADAERREAPSPQAPAAHPITTIDLSSNRYVHLEWRCADRPTLEAHIEQWLQNYGYGYSGAASQPVVTDGGWMAVGTRAYSCD